MKFLRKMPKTKYWLPAAVVVLLLAAYATGSLAFVKNKIAGSDSDTPGITGRAVLESVPGVSAAKNTAKAAKQKASDAVERATNTVRNVRESVTETIETITEPFSRADKDSGSNSPSGLATSGSPPPSRTIKNDPAWAQQSDAHNLPAFDRQKLLPSSPGTKLGLAAIVLASLGGVAVVWKTKKRKRAF